jgi:hypothetical protein
LVRQVGDAPHTVVDLAVCQPVADVRVGAVARPDRELSAALSGWQELQADRKAHLRLKKGIVHRVEGTESRRDHRIAPGTLRGES